MQASWQNDLYAGSIFKIVATLECITNFSLCLTYNGQLLYIFLTICYRQTLLPQILRFTIYVCAMGFHISIVNILFLLVGLFSTILGILLFMGKTKWGNRIFLIGNFQVTSELIGFLLFFFGIVLMLVFFIPALGPRLSSPGMS